MTWRRLHLFMVCTLGLSSLVVLYLGRKPLCIDSRVVERIDRVSPQGVESAWRCSLNRDTGFSPFLSRHLTLWEPRIKEVEENLGRLRGFQKPLRIVILSERPWAYHLSEGLLFIGERMLASRGHLERAFVKAWLRENDKDLPAPDLIEESQADLLQKIVSNSLALEDGGRGLRMRFKARWPQVMKDAEAYCASPWKASEHYEPCEKNPAALGDLAWRLSLRPLVSAALISAWKEQSLADRLRMLSALPQWLGSVSGAEISRSEGTVGPSASSRAVRDVIRLVSRRSLLVGGERTVSFAGSFSGHLRDAGFREEQPELNLDVLVVSEDGIKNPRSLVKNLSLLAGGEKNLRIAVKDPENLWVLPNQRRLPWRELEGLKAERIAVLRCGNLDFDFDWVLSFEGLAQRLFVVDACGSGNPPDLNPWVKNGAEAFAAANKGVHFIQFHLPSLALRGKELKGRSAVLPVIERHDVNDPVLRTLGWQDLRRSEESDAWHPRAFVDAIEWFRVN
ncbi:MAG: hypothetical protein KF802_10920 [Bdellovibrionaceae bacterium]|nr:hypothetical protein [Pseudobdellovibrionaceae bacterium]